MRIELPFPEALALGTLRGPLPSVIASIGCGGSTIRADLDLREIPSESIAARLAFAAAGTVAVTLRLADFSDGIATVAVTAHARGLPAHKLLPLVLDPIEKAVREAGLPDGMVRIQRADPDPLVLVDLQLAVASRTEGLTITGFSLRDAVFQVDAELDDFRIR